MEISIRNAGLPLRALAQICSGRIPAACGGAITNLMAGGPLDGTEGSWAYYETMGTAAGPCQGADRVDGIHCDMTNTLNTPIESPEHYYPIEMTQYGFRESSAGAGECWGGYESPRQRDAGAVIEDLRKGLTSNEAPRPMYGLRPDETHEP